MEDSVVTVDDLEFLIKRNGKYDVISLLSESKYHKEPEYQNFRKLPVQKNTTDEHAKDVIRSYTQGHKEGQKAGKEQFQKEIRKLLGLDVDLLVLQNKVDRMRRLNID